VAALVEEHIVKGVSFISAYLRYSETAKLAKQSIRLFPTISVYWLWTQPETQGYMYEFQGKEIDRDSVKHRNYRAKPY